MSALPFAKGPCRVWRAALRVFALSLIMCWVLGGVAFGQDCSKSYNLPVQAQVIRVDHRPSGFEAVQDRVEAIGTVPATHLVAGDVVCITATFNPAVMIPATNPALATWVWAGLHRNEGGIAGYAAGGGSL